MTQEIIEMARDSGMELYGLGKDRARFVHHLEAFAKLVAEKALAEHAMQQRLGRELLQEPLELCQYGQEPASCTSNPMDCQCAIDAALAQSEQEPKIGCVNHDCNQCKAQPKQKPVAWAHYDTFKNLGSLTRARFTATLATKNTGACCIALYTHPINQKEFK